MISHENPKVDQGTGSRKNPPGGDSGEKRGWLRSYVNNEGEPERRMTLGKMTTSMRMLP